MSAIARAAAAAIALSSTVAVAAATPVVTPSGETVPENLLRIELHLARPLRHALAMDRVHLVDARGAEIAGAFLDLPLAADDDRTITLLLHPGRVKTGVGANLALGRALRAGEDVTLVVDDPQLPATLRKSWHVAAPLSQGLLDDDWRLAIPRASSSAPLRVALNSPLTASSARYIAVRGPDGERVAGTVSLKAGETEWEFRPARAWRPGRYAVVVHPQLEDVAGNRSCAPFEAVGLSAIECPQAERAFALRP